MPLRSVLDCRFRCYATFMQHAAPRFVTHVLPSHVRSLPMDGYGWIKARSHTRDSTHRVRSLLIRWCVPLRDDFLRFVPTAIFFALLFTIYTRYLHAFTHTPATTTLHVVRSTPRCSDSDVRCWFVTVDLLPISLRFRCSLPIPHTLPFRLLPTHYLAPVVVHIPRYHVCVCSVTLRCSLYICCDLPRPHAYVPRFVVTTFGLITLHVYHTVCSRYSVYYRSSTRSAYTTFSGTLPALPTTRW